MEMHLRIRAEIHCLSKMQIQFQTISPRKFPKVFRQFLRLPLESWLFVDSIPSRPSLTIEEFFHRRRDIFAVMKSVPAAETIYQCPRIES